MKDKSSYLFNVVNVNTRKSIMITGSPSKAETLLQKGIRIEVFKNNFYLETIFYFSFYINFWKLIIGATKPLLLEVVFIYDAVCITHHISHMYYSL